MDNNNKNNTVFFIIAVILIISTFIFSRYMSNRQGKSGSSSDENTKESTASESMLDTVSKSEITRAIKNFGSASSKAGSELKITDKKYQAVIHTNYGDMRIDLYADKTPLTVLNFVSLAKSNFYNNTIFHRVIKGFMIQGGDPGGDGTGGPGYTFEDEPFEGNYDRGVLAMANRGPDTNGSQFFIMHQNYNLPKDYVIFGKLTEGFDVLDKIADVSVIAGPSGENSMPVDSIIVNSIEIIETSL